MASISVSSRKRNLIFVNIVISCIASSLLATALSTALLPISDALDVSVTTGQWLTSGYSLAMAIAMPLTAFIINRFPTRRLYLTAQIIFMSGLVISGLSLNFPMMMCGRCLQATGGGMLTAMAQVIILTIFPAEKKGTAMGWYGLSIGAAPVIAPTLGGIIVDTVGWRMIFFLSLIIMAVSFIYAICVFADVIDTKKSRFDVKSFIMCGLAFGGITLGIGNIGSNGFTSVPVILPLVIGIVAAAVFTTMQLHMRDDAFLDLRIMKNKAYAISVIGSMLLYINVYGASTLLPLYVQESLGMAATVAGLLTLPGSLVSAVFSPFVGKIYDKLGMRVLFIFGSFCLIVCNLLMCFVTLDTGLWVPMVLNIVRNIGVSSMLMPLVTWGASTVSVNKTSHATALLTSLRTIGGSLGTAIFVAVMTMASASATGLGANAASMHGINAGFFGMFLTDLIVIFLAFWGTAEKKKEATPI